LTIFSELCESVSRAAIAGFQQKSSIFQSIASLLEGRAGAAVTRLHWVALQLRSRWARRL